ncbi:MAG: hypothetical protein Q7K26_05200 [bacterium]|nr:hypothetical protein [bacterium]
MIIELLTAALVVITGFYALVTHRILKANESAVDAMKEQSRAISRPYISIAPVLEPDNPIFYLKIFNNGKSAAKNLRLTIDKSFFQFGENKDLATFIAFNNKIDSFPPGAQITFALAQGFVVFATPDENPKLPRTFSIKAEYEFENTSVKEQNDIDLRPFLNADVPQDPYVRKLKDINDSIKNLSTK